MTTSEKKNSGCISNLLIILAVYIIVASIVGWNTSNDALIANDYSCMAFESAMSQLSINNEVPSTAANCILGLRSSELYFRLIFVGMCNFPALVVLCILVVGFIMRGGKSSSHGGHS